MSWNLFGDLWLTWGGRATTVTEAQPDRTYETAFYGFGWRKHLLGVHWTIKKGWVGEARS